MMKEEDCVVPPMISPSPTNQDLGMDMATESGGSTTAPSVAMQHPFLIAHSQKKKRKTTSVADRIVQCLERMVEQYCLESQSRTPVVNPFSIKKCLDVLDSVEGIEAGGEMWFFATRVFLKPAYREMFLAIEPDDLRLRWLEMLMQLDKNRGRGGGKKQ